MKPFSLHTVLKYRKQMENKAVNRLAETERKLIIIKKQYDKKNAQYQQLVHELSNRQNQPMDVTEFVRFDEHIQFLSSQLKEIQEKLDDAKKLVLKARNHVFIKSKERKVMEKLRDKQNLAYKQYIEKKEAATMDEIAVMRHGRKV
jgi:flagellar protein FliJ